MLFTSVNRPDECWWVPTKSKPKSSPRTPPLYVNSPVVQRWVFNLMVVFTLLLNRQCFSLFLHFLCLIWTEKQMAVEIIKYSQEFMFFHINWFKSKIVKLEILKRIRQEFQYSSYIVTWVAQHSDPFSSVCCGTGCLHDGTRYCVDKHMLLQTYNTVYKLTSDISI